MKHLFFASLSLIAIGLIAFNLSVKNDSIAPNGVELSNIQTLQASAAESARCDGSSTATCTIELGGMKGTGTGKAVYE